MRSNEVKHLTLAASIVAALIMALATGCITAPRPVSLPAKAAPDYELSVEAAQLRAHVLALTGTSEPRNSTHIEALDQAAAYIAGQFKAMGLTISEQRYTSEDKPYKNVLARYGRDGLPRVVIGAHYDVAGRGPGADDNASGVAGLIELARLVTAHEPELDIQLEFVAFTLEEPPNFGKVSMGSAVHANALKEEGAPVKLMVSLEMIGYYSDEPGSQRSVPIITQTKLPSAGNFIAVVGRPHGDDPVALVAEAMKGCGQVGVVALKAPLIAGAGLSDQLNYWRAGYNALMITDTSFFRNPNYHARADTPDTLDYARMAEVVKGLYCAVLAL